MHFDINNYKIVHVILIMHLYKKHLMLLLYIYK